ncbi:MAG: helix-turn-helix transcriptional regulator [Clostridia bacterium]|nr:helix-turn-helix transcriptional regulator [Clostridia bacterium]
MKNKISDRLKELLKEKGITSSKLATDLGVSKSVVHYWVNGNTTPNVDYVIKLALYFSVSSDFLLGLSED